MLLLQLQIRLPYLTAQQLHLIPPFQRGHVQDDGVLLNQDNYDGLACPIDVDNTHDEIIHDAGDEW